MCIIFRGSCLCAVRRTDSNPIGSMHIRSHSIHLICLNARMTGMLHLYLHCIDTHHIYNAQSDVVPSLSPPNVNHLTMKVLSLRTNTLYNRSNQYNTLNAITSSVQIAFIRRALHVHIQRLCITEYRFLLRLCNGCHCIILVWLVCHDTICLKYTHFLVLITFNTNPISPIGGYLIQSVSTSTESRANTDVNSSHGWYVSLLFLWQFCICIHVMCMKEWIIIYRT
eukprot:817144_1